MIGERKLYRMKSAYDPTIPPPQQLVGDPLKAEISEKQARSIRYQLANAKLPLTAHSERRLVRAGPRTADDGSGSQKRSPSRVAPQRPARFHILIGQGERRHKHRMRKCADSGLIAIARRADQIAWS